MPFLAGYEDSDGNEYFLSDTLHPNKGEAQDEIDTYKEVQPDMVLDFFIGETSRLLLAQPGKPCESARHLY